MRALASMLDIPQAAATRCTPRGRIWCGLHLSKIRLGPGALTGRAGLGSVAQSRPQRVREGSRPLCVFGGFRAGMSTRSHRPRATRRDPDRWLGKSRGAPDCPVRPRIAT